MQNLIEDVITSLKTIKNKNITDIQYEDGVFSFRYGGGKFIILKSIAPTLDTAYLNFFHETSFNNKKRLIEIPDFEIKIEKFYWGRGLKIKNFLEFSDYNKMLVDDAGYMTMSLRDLPDEFPYHFKDKLIKDNFRIYL